MKKNIIILLAAAAAIGLSSCKKSAEYEAAKAAIDKYEDGIESAQDCIAIGEVTVESMDISELIYKVTDEKEKNKLSVRYKKVAEKGTAKANELCRAEAVE